jgi:perosamine synthetase
MHSLIPVENHDYTLRDATRALWLAARGLEGECDQFELPGLGTCVPMRSGRFALVTAIRAMGFRPRAIIGVPLFCCPVVFKAIEMAGCTPRFLDIDQATYCVCPKDLEQKWASLDGVLAVHIFGHPCDMKALERAARGKPIIEDCAQALGSRLNGSAVGAFGTASCFSFGSGKYLSLGQGGALYSRDPRLNSRFLDVVRSMPRVKEHEDIRHVVKTYIRSSLRRRPLYGAVGHNLWSYYNKNTDYNYKTPIIQGRMFTGDIALLKRRLCRLDDAIEAQRRNADTYLHRLALDPKMLVVERPDWLLNRYYFPICFQDEAQRASVAGYLKQRNICSIEVFKDLPRIASQYHGYKGDCPRAETAADRVLVLPCNYGLGILDLERIVTSMNQICSEVTSDVGSPAPLRVPASV